MTRTATFTFLRALHTVNVDGSAVTIARGDTVVGRGNLDGTRIRITTGWMNEDPDLHFDLIEAAEDALGA